MVQIVENLIIGNSAAGLNALASFRKHDQDSPVMIISREAGTAYSRVLLPYYLGQKIGYDNLFLRTLEYYDQLQVQTCFNHFYNLGILLLSRYNCRYNNYDGFDNV